MLSRFGIVAKNDDSSGESPRFREVSGEAGVDFVLRNSPTSRKHLIETMPGGVAAFDYDNDGWTDLFFTNGAAVPSLQKTSPVYWDRLYRNLGGMKFEDVTRHAGVAGSGYSMGVAAADYDNDGDVDLFVAGVREVTLWKNTGSGKFENATKHAGLFTNYWSVGGGWIDYDKDGWLDLVVVHYVQWELRSVLRRRPRRSKSLLPSPSF